MLRHLEIRDFAIVDELALRFDDGFTALTGETGAGKSILVDALAFVVGARADSTTVRTGAARAEVSAEFDATGLPALAALLDEQALTGDDDACLLRRVVEAGGRSRAFVNGRACTLQQLREAGECLLDIHGQHSHQSLLRPAARRDLLDSYAGATALAAEVAVAFRAWSAAAARRTAAETDRAGLAREREDLEWQTRELTTLAFSGEEWASVNVERGRLAHAQSLLDAAQRSLDLLSEGEAPLGEALGRAAHGLEHVLEHDARLQESLDLLRAAEAQINDAVYQLRRYRDSLDLDPRRLAEVDQRIDAVLQGARRFRVPPDELPAVQARFAARLAELGASADVEALGAAEQAARASFDAAAARLTAARTQAAHQLDREVTQALQLLAMAGASFEVSLQAAATPTAHGLEQVEFLFAAHAGAEPRPLAKVASGGELARVSLALQTATSAVAAVPTLVFDEVDTGIGGRVAEIVGRMLQGLGRKHQVLCVTHLPQVAACADHQWQVTKTTRDAASTSQVAVLDAAARVEEIARMLGGVQITDTTRRHAAEMLAGAKSPNAPPTGPRTKRPRARA